MNGNSANGWDEARISRYITDKIEESLDTEYKAAGALDKDSNDAKIQITKDVSAMANSEGGLIIYGLVEHSDKRFKYLAERLDPVDRTKISKEWLEHITSQIRPRIADLKIIPVPLKSGPDDVAYVVEIPQGVTAHQARDKRYYKRYNFEAVAMEDYEVRDVMNRSKLPRLEIETEIFLHNVALYDSDDQTYKVRAWIVNYSDSVTANNVTIIVGNLPPAWDIEKEVWDHVRSTLVPGKFISKNPINPSERQVIASWKIGKGHAPKEVTRLPKGLASALFNDSSRATFDGEKWDFSISVFAKDQAKMEFLLHYSKEEIDGLFQKRFQPSKTNV